MSLRSAGIAAVLGGSFWALTWLIIAADQFVGNGEGNVPIAFLTMFLACAGVLAALAGLSAFQARKHPRAIWLSFLVPAAGAVLVMLGFFGMALWEAMWTVGMIGLFVFAAGSAIFAIVTYRTAVLSRSASAMLAVGAAMQTVGLVVVLGGGGTSPSQSVMFIGMAVFALGWILLGADAIRRDRAAVSSSPTPA